jgi:hypothetical protein
MASLSSPVPGMRASVKNLALRQDSPMSAANAGFGAAPADSVAGEAAGGWVGTGAGAVSKGEADCVLRCDAHACNGRRPQAHAATRLSDFACAAVYCTLRHRLGKTANDEFTLLCGPPLSPLQGFAVACSSLSK